MRTDIFTIKCKSHVTREGWSGSLWFYRVYELIRQFCIVTKSLNLQYYKFPTFIFQVPFYLIMNLLSRQLCLSRASSNHIYFIKLCIDTIWLIPLLLMLSTLVTTGIIFKIYYFIFYNRLLNYKILIAFKDFMAQVNFLVTAVFVYYNNYVNLY